jgi:ribosomal protein S3AE
MKRYELLEYTQFTKNKEIPKEIRKSLISFLQKRAYECILKNDLKKFIYGQLRSNCDEFYFVLS